MTNTEKGSFKEYLDKNYSGPFMATDAIIRYDDGNKNGIILIERRNFPFGKAFPGGIAENITLADNARKEVKEETGLDFLIEDEDKPFCVLSDPKQDPRAFIGTAVYLGIGRGKMQAGDDAKAAAVYSFEDLAELVRNDGFAFPHHRKIARRYLYYCKGVEI